MTAEDKLLDNGYSDVIFFTSPDYESALIGVSSDNRAVYDYDLMVEYLVQIDGMTEDEAAEWIDYNVIGSYIADGPIVIYPLIEFD
jgi:hypothetical protein